MLQKSASTTEKGDRFFAVSAADIREALFLASGEQLIDFELAVTLTKLILQREVYCEVLNK